MKSQVQQPLRISLKGQKYTRVAKFKQLDGPVSEGPFYRAEGLADHPYVYMPDARFQLGMLATPAHMHRIGPLQPDDPLLSA